MNHQLNNVRDPINKENDANKLREVGAPSRAPQPLALIDCGEFSLLISSKDIVTSMSAQKIVAPTIPHACGAIEFEQNSVPVFAFNKALQLQSRLPSSQMTLVVIQHESYLFSLGAVALQKLDMMDLHFYPVPVNMRSRKQPFTQFAIVNKRVAGLSSAAELWRLLKIRHATTDIPAINPQHICKEQVNG